MANVLKTRQGFVPLVLEYIKFAKADPLHLKNNFVKVQFNKLLQLVVKESIVANGVKAYKDLDEDNLFVFLVRFVRRSMKCGTLSKKLIKFFESDPKIKSNKSFDFRFRGRESFKFLQYFPILIDELKRRVPPSSHPILEVVFYQTLLLRKLVSLSVRIEEISSEDTQEMTKIGRQLPKVCCYYDTDITPSMWTFCNVAPVHCKELLELTGFGLGINTMEGREQKHQQLSKYSAKTTFQDRWPQIFRHEFIDNIYLKEKGFDTVKYRKRGKKYVPSPGPGQCVNCCLALCDDSCAWCDSPGFAKIVSDCGL